MYLIMKRVIAIFLVAICFCSCNSESNFSNPTEIDLVTGMYLVDNVANSVGKVGNPNVLQSNVSVTLYPNPSLDILNVISGSSIKNIWIIKGIPTSNFNNTDFNSVLKPNLYSNFEIKNKSIFDVENINGKNSIQIDLASFEKGYYRVFVELEDGLISWDNIYFRASQFEIDEINYWN